MSRIRSAFGRVFARKKQVVEVAVEPPPKPGIDPEAFTQLQLEVAELRRWFLASRKVEMVDFGDIRAFLYADDLGYKQIAGTYKGKQPDGERRELSDQRTPAERFANHGEPLISMLLSHFWLERIPFVALDIGCQYGISAIAMAQIIRSCGAQNQVYAFDPGVAGSLAPFNIELNHLTDLIKFEPMAVTAKPGPVMVYTELAHSENNRIVNRAADCEFSSYVKMGTSVDAYLQSNRGGLTSSPRSTPKAGRWKCSAAWPRRYRGMAQPA